MSLISGLGKGPHPKSLSHWLCHVVCLLSPSTPWLLVLSLTSESSRVSVIPPYSLPPRKLKVKLPSAWRKLLLGSFWLGIAYVEGNTASILDVTALSLHDTNCNKEHRVFLTSSGRLISIPSGPVIPKSRASLAP